MEPTRPEDTDRAARAAGELRVLVGRIRRRLKEVDNADGVTLSQMSVLSHLDREGPASPGALAARERVRPQSMGATIAALEERGLVERRPDPDDGRRVVVSLSEAGEAAIRGTRQARQEWLTGVIRDRYSGAELDTLLSAFALLDRLTQP